MWCDRRRAAHPGLAKERSARQDGIFSRSDLRWYRRRGSKYSPIEYLRVVILRQAATQAAVPWRRYPIGWPGRHTASLATEEVPTGINRFEGTDSLVVHAIDSFVVATA